MMLPPGTVAMLYLPADTDPYDVAIAMVRATRRAIEGRRVRRRHSSSA
jgi:hypothetical protein